MQEHKERNFPEEDEEYEYYDVPPFQSAKVFIYLLLASLVMLFLFLSLSYAYTRVEQGVPPIQVPIIFVLNTLLLMCTSYLLHAATKAYKADLTTAYQRRLLLTIGLTIAFMLLQMVGWQQLLSVNAEQFSASDNARAYLMVISVLHFFHIMAGLPFLISFYITARRKMVEPVSVLIYFSDPIKRLRLQLLTIYWHFLDALWIYLVLFFWINSLI